MHKIVNFDYPKKCGNSAIFLLLLLLSLLLQFVLQFIFINLVAVFFDLDFPPYTRLLSFDVILNLVDINFTISSLPTIITNNN